MEDTYHIDSTVAGNRYHSVLVTKINTDDTHFAGACWLEKAVSEFEKKSVASWKKVELDGKRR